MTMLLDERLLRYTIAELYPYYEGLDFILTLQNPVEFSNMIDIRGIRTEIRNLEDIELVEGRTRTVQEQLRLEELQAFEEAYTELQSGENRVQRAVYRRLPLITTAKFYVFSLSLNILRLIGGYGALAYSGNE